MSSESPRQSGLPRRRSELIVGMRDRGWIVQIVCLNLSCSTPLNILMILSFCMEIVKVDKEFNCDVIICFTTLHGVIALLYRTIFKKAKVIFCDRADSVEGKRLESNLHCSTRLKRPWELCFLRIMEKETSLRCDMVIFNSEARRMKVEKRIGKHLSNCHIVPNNVNPSWVIEWLSEVSEDQKRLENISSLFEGRKPIGFVGNLHEIGNGLDILLEAFQFVLTKIPEAMLVIVGEGPDKLQLKQKVHELNLANHVFFAGWVSNPLFYVMNFDLFVSPARHHSCPNSILESLMCGVPVIGSRVGGIPEILEHDEFLFESKNIRELADKIMAILTGQLDSSRAKSLITQLRRKFEFDWQETMTSAIEEVLETDSQHSSMDMKKHKSQDRFRVFDALIRYRKYAFTQAIILSSFISHIFSSVHPLIACISILSGWVSIIVIPGYLFLDLFLKQPISLHQELIYSVSLSSLISSIAALALFAVKKLYWFIPLFFIINEGWIVLSVIRAYITKGEQRYGE